MATGLAHRVLVVGALCTVLAGCTATPAQAPTVPPGPAVESAELMAERAVDLIYPGPAYPVVAGPIDPDYALYADAVRILAGTGGLSAAERDRAVVLMAEGWPEKDEAGYHWLALTRALGALDAPDRVPAERIAPALAWVRSALASVQSDDGGNRQVIAAAQLARELLRGWPDRAGLEDLDGLLDRAAGRLSCVRAGTPQDAIPAAVLAVAADQPCVLPTSVATAARDPLRQAQENAGLDDQAAVLANAAPLVAVGSADRADFLNRAQRALSTLGQPQYSRGGEFGQSLVVTVVDAITTVGGTYTLPPTQVRNLQRIIRSESRLPDAVGQGDPLDTAVAAAVLRRLGGPTPGPVNWDADLILFDRTVLALALDRRQLPAPAQARVALGSTPPSTMTLAYLAVAYPELCVPQMSSLRRTIDSVPDLGEWTAHRLFASILFVSATPTCGGADQSRLVAALTTALDALQTRRASGQGDGAVVTSGPDLVDTWYIGEAGCLIGRHAHYLPTASALREAVRQQVGHDQIRAGTTIRHLYAALRLTDLVNNEDSCGATWWGKT